MICSNTASDEKTRKIQEMTQKDDVLQQLKIFITNGWPKQKSDLTGEILSYWSFQEELSVINGTIYKGHRIVIPKLMRQEILENLHQSHMGISKTKARARETVYWPNINQHIEMLIKKCEVCQTYQKQQQKEPMIPSDIPIYPFQIVASDLFNWNNQDFVIVVDYYSKYWEIERLYDTKSITIVKKMKKMFSRLGIPETLRSENGLQYTVQVLKLFSKEWKVKHVTSTPEYPKSNGFVKRHIQIVKNLLTKAKQSGKDPYLAMLESRNCPVENSSSPAQLIYGRCLRSLLPIYQEKSNQNKTSTMINMQNVRSNLKKGTMFAFIKKKNGRKLQSKRHVQNLAVTSSRYKMARYIEEIETHSDLSNLKKHLLRYLTMKTTMFMMKFKLVMRSWKSKARINHLQKQQSEQHDMDE